MRREPDEPDHPILQLQRLAGNRAVSSLVTVQRRLKATGSGKDVAEMLRLLGPAAGMKLKHDPKTTKVSPTGKPTKPVSAELATRLQGIMDDPKRHAEVSLGRTKEDIAFGGFPDDVANKPVQDVRIDHLIAAEKGVRGMGVSKLAHEIIENFEAHGQAAQDDPRFAFSLTHEQALKAEDTILAELQQASGDKLSGARGSTFKFRTGTGKRPKYQWVEAFANDFLLWDEGIDQKKAFSNFRRVGRVPVATFTVKGFSATVEVPKDADPTLQAVADLLKKDPSASVVFRPTADAKLVKEVEKWGLKLGDRIGQLIGESDELARASGRFDTAPPTVGTPNRVVISVSRPDI